MITGIHHIQLTAPRECEGKARKFVAALLGMLEIEKPPELKKRGGVWFEFNGQRLHIGVEEDPRFLQKRRIPLFRWRDWTPCAKS